jgi:hypothetical protein
VTPLCTAGQRFAFLPDSANRMTSV